MLPACFLPLLPAVISKLTFWPSFSVLKPGMLIAEKCAKRSSPPPSGVMNPKPFESLNHFTVPVAMDALPFKKKLNRASEALTMSNFQASKEPHQQHRGRHSQEVRTKHAATVYVSLIGVKLAGYARFTLCDLGRRLGQYHRAHRVPARKTL